MPNAYQTMILAEPALIDYWMLDELSGTVAVDAKGTRNGAYSTTPRAPILGKPGIPAGGTSVLMVSDNVNSDGGILVSPFAFGGTAGLSIEFWVYFPVAFDLQRLIFSHGTAPGAIWARFMITPSNKITFDIDDGGLKTVTSDSSLSLNQWHHVCGTAGGALQTLYIDGVAQAAVNAIGTPGSLSVVRSVFIGGGMNAYSDANCQMDEVAIYNAPLSAARAGAHHSAGMTAPAPALICYVNPQAVQIDQAASNATFGNVDPFAVK